MSLLQLFILNIYKMAFIVYGKSNPAKPYYTVPRIIVQSTYSIKDLFDIIKNKT